ncbi:hypothetical protein C8J56DRAFT_899824 [Mycena floridula]|nr:hypothetical protein C8J56DRAFT_899824 [Mycena floridula]
MSLLQAHGIQVWLSGPFAEAIPLPTPTVKKSGSTVEVSTFLNIPYALKSNYVVHWNQTEEPVTALIQVVSLSPKGKTERLEMEWAMKKEEPSSQQGSTAGNQLRRVRLSEKVVNMRKANRGEGALCVNIYHREKFVKATRERSDEDIAEIQELPREAEEEIPWVAFRFNFEWAPPSPSDASVVDPRPAGTRKRKMSENVSTAQTMGAVEQGNKARNLKTTKRRRERSNKVSDSAQATAAPMPRNIRRKRDLLEKLQKEKDSLEMLIEDKKLEVSILELQLENQRKRQELAQLSAGNHKRARVR